MNPKIIQADMDMLYAIGKVKLQKHQNGYKKNPTTTYTQMISKINAQLNIFTLKCHQSI